MNAFISRNRGEGVTDFIISTLIPLLSTLCIPHVNKERLICSRSTLTEKQKLMLNCPIGLFFITKDYLQSEECKTEFFYAKEIGSMKCIYILLENIDPTYKSGIVVHLYGGDMRIDAYKLKENKTDEQFVDAIYQEIRALFCSPDFGLNIIAHDNSTEIKNEIANSESKANLNDSVIQSNLYKFLDVFSRIATRLFGIMLLLLTSLMWPGSKVISYLKKIKQSISKQSNGVYKTFDEYKEAKKSLLNESNDATQSFVIEQKLDKLYKCVHYVRNCDSIDDKEQELLCFKPLISKISKNINKDSVEVLHRIGTIYGDASDHETALKLYLGAEKIHKENNEYKHIGFLRYDIAKSYIILNKYNRALYYLRMVCNSHQYRTNARFACKCLYERGIAYAAIGQLNDAVVNAKNAMKRLSSMKRRNCEMEKLLTKCELLIKACSENCEIEADYECLQPLIDEDLKEKTIFSVENSFENKLYTSYELETEVTNDEVKSFGNREDVNESYSDSDTEAHHKMQENLNLSSELDSESAMLNEKAAHDLQEIDDCDTVDDGEANNNLTLGTGNSVLFPEVVIFLYYCRFVCIGGFQAAINQVRLSYEDVLDALKADDLVTIENEGSIYHGIQFKRKHKRINFDGEFTATMEKKVVKLVETAAFYELHENMPPNINFQKYLLRCEDTTFGESFYKLATAFADNKFYPNAIDFFKKANYLFHKQSKSSVWCKVKALYNVALLYFKQGRNCKASKYFEHAFNMLMSVDNDDAFTFQCLTMKNATNKKHVSALGNNTNLD